MKSRTHLVAGLALVAGIVACKDAPPGEWHQEAGYRWREFSVGRGSPGFTAMSAGRTGIDFQNTVSESLLLGNRILGQGAGIALGDVDSDGLTDVFLARTEGCDALYRNVGGWKFEDITERAGVASCTRNSTGAVFADIDGANGLDLVVLATRGPNAVFVNNGSGVFTERRDLGVDSTGKGGTTIAMADVDADGDLDMFVANYNAYNVDDSLPPQQRAFSQMVRQVGPNRFEIVPEHQAHYRLVMRPDMGGMRMSQRGATDDFYLNDGGRFTKVPFSAGRFRDAAGKAIEESESFTLGARFADLNGDGAPDLYVANDFEDVDELWFNDGSGNFRRADWKSLRQVSNSAMGVDVGDVNGDGLPDIFEVDMLSNEPGRLKTQIPTHTALPKVPGDMESQLQQQRNLLFVNRGDGTFADASMAAGVQASGWSWSTMLTDVDLDGWQDILITNGHLWDIMDADTHERLQNRLTDVHWQRTRWEFPPLKLKNVAFRNRGDMTFEDASERWKFGVEDDISHTLAAGDLDEDGDLDVVVSRLGAPVQLMRNDAIAPRVKVRLKGDGLNTRAVGAKVRLLNGAVPVQEREVAVGGLYMSHSDYDIAFAMGEADSATIVVDWRDGRRSLISGVRPNRFYEITPETAAPTTNGAKPILADRSSTSAAPLFVDASAQLGGHQHVDPPFDDWERQFLLPNTLSHLGPGVSWFDYDRDGDEDLLIGAGKSGRVAVMRNDNGRMVPARAQLPAAEHDLTGVLGIASENGSRVLMGMASWEGVQGPGGAAPVIASVLGVAAGARGLDARMEQVLGAGPASVGPLAAADVDGDGDLDLFVGGRVVPGAYPRSAPSVLMRNDNGMFVGDNANDLQQVGLVSAATFADIDGDGDPDLLLAREWDSVLLLINNAGKLTPAPASWGLGKWTGRWNGIATGDIDGDGRLDIVATSWGRNTMMQADSARPLVLLHGQFGSSGEEEMLIARQDPSTRALMPLNSFPRVRIAIPDLPDRIRSFGEYSTATVEQVLGAAAAKVSRKEIVTLDHMVFFNRGARFDAVPLPHEAQLAPAFYAGVADFDGDGAEDIFLSQNFYPTAVGLPRYDAGRGLLLLGNGKGALEPMSGAQSGLLVYGDQRGAGYADFDADGRLDLAISQNSAETKLYNNRQAKPGLRVRVQGPPSNPDAVGAQIRIDYSGQSGPVREIQAGSGYWSQNGAVQVFGLSGNPTSVRVRWPGGAESVVPVRSGAREVVVRR
ncbi:MAG TPA: FG-GAP-like repeat-containing protein [Gemmatimonadaceae bacterium]|nr:FG-GAP-like repeat-containing protein [Gemmatimonadaceae bacterium]